MIERSEMREVVLARDSSSFRRTPGPSDFLNGHPEPTSLGPGLRRDDVGLAQWPTSRGRHSRESGNPSWLLHQSKLDSRFRRNDVKQTWSAALNSSETASKEQRRRHNKTIKQCLVCCLTLLWSLCATATAPPPPSNLTSRADFVQKLGAPLPMAARFTDASGQTADLAHWIDGRPTLLMLGYFRCPNLCDVAEQGMAHAIALSKLTPGQDMSVLFVSIDPRDKPADALAKQRMIASMQGNANASSWHFLTGHPASIEALAQAVGYRYFYDARLDQYAHPAGLVIATADGKVNQYLMGVNYVPQSLHLAVVAASHHTLGSIVDQLVLLCCGYDPATGRYTVTITRIMQGLGIGFVAILLIMFVLLRRYRPGAQR